CGKVLRYHPGAFQRPRRARKTPDFSGARLQNVRLVPVRRRTQRNDMKFRSLTLITALYSVACGSSSGDPAPTSSPSVAGASDPCGLNSGFKGDELCIAPPAAAEGIQLHVGPSSYDDAAAVAPYVIQPGEEDVRCFVTRPAESGFYYFKQQNRMRSGSHHML